MKITAKCEAHDCNIRYETEGNLDGEIVDGVGPYVLDFKDIAWHCEGMDQDLADAEEADELDEDYDDTWCRDSWYFEVELERVNNPSKPPYTHKITGK